MLRIPKRIQVPDYSYQTGYDVANGTGYQTLAGSVGQASDACGAGVLQLF